MTSSVLEMPKIDDNIQVYRSEVNATVSKVTTFTLSIFQQDCGYTRVYCHKLMNQLDELNYQNWGHVLPRQLKKNHRVLKNSHQVTKPRTNCNKNRVQLLEVNDKLKQTLVPSRLLRASVHMLAA